MYAIFGGAARVYLQHHVTSSLIHDLNLLQEGGFDLSGFRLLNKQYPQVLMPASLLKHNMAATTGLGGPENPLSLILILGLTSRPPRTGYFWDLKRAKLKQCV